MAIKSISSDYVGRKKDISIFQYPDATISPIQETSTSFETKIYAKQTVSPSFGKNTRFCSGVQKLVQSYAIILLTNIDSQKAYPEFGTNFLYTIQGGISPVDKVRASQIFYIANYDAVNTLKAYQIDHPDTPSDERISRVELSGINLYSGYAAFDITIYTEAGDAINFLIPLPK